MSTWSTNFRRNFPCLLVVPAVCFGIARTHAGGSQGLCYVLTTLQSFCKIFSPICALNLELLYGRTLIESNSYHHHHHNGHEICFVLLSNIGKHEICLWSEIIWTREVKLKEMLYQVFSFRHCHKISMPRCSIPWVFILYAEEEETRPVTTQKYSFRCKKSIHALFGKYTIPYQ